MEDAIAAAITAMNEPKTCSTTILRRYLLDANKDRKQYQLGEAAAGLRCGHLSTRGHWSAAKAAACCAVVLPDWIYRLLHWCFSVIEQCVFWGKRLVFVD